MCNLTINKLHNATGDSKSPGDLSMLPGIPPHAFHGALYCVVAQGPIIALRYFNRYVYCTD